MIQDAAQRTQLLEVIVTSAAEARAAEEGGAGRVELVRDLSTGGLTPSLRVIEDVTAAVAVPVRVMLRATPTFDAGTQADVDNLCKTARTILTLSVEGLVIGFTHCDTIDLIALGRIMEAAPKAAITFHRAIEAVGDPFSVIAQLKGLSAIDRVLYNGGAGSWTERATRLDKLQSTAGPEITVIAGGGITKEGFRILAASTGIREFHSGRAARDGSGRVAVSHVKELCRIVGSVR